MIVSLGAGRDASVALRDRIALDDAAVARTLTAPRPGLGELVVLSTCHRTELYATSTDSTDGAHALARLLPGVEAGDHAHLRFRSGGDAVEHLVRVACGLDSLVVGEPQILAQVRRALSAAASHGAAGPVLGSVFSHAIRAGRVARSMMETPPESIGRLVASDLTARLGPLRDRPGAVVGSGEAASDAALALRDAGARLAILGRSPVAVARLAAGIKGEPHPLAAMAGVLSRSEFAVVAVAGGVLVRGRHIAPRQEPLTVVDVSVPRAVDLDGHPSVTVRRLEDLSPETAAAALEPIHALVRRTTTEIVRRLDPAGERRDIAALLAAADRIARAEAARTLTALKLPGEQAARIEAMARRIAAKLVHRPVVAMRDGDPATGRAVRRIFDLDAEDR